MLVVAVLRHHLQTAAPTCRATPITVAMMLLPRTMPVASCTRHMLAAAALRRKRTLRLQLLQNPMLLYMLSRSTTLTSAALVIRAGSITMQIRPMRHIIRSPMLTLTTQNPQITKALMATPVLKPRTHQVHKAEISSNAATSIKSDGAADAGGTDIRRA